MIAILLARVNEMYEVGAIDRETTSSSAGAIKRGGAAAAAAGPQSTKTIPTWLGAGHRSSRCFRSGILPTGASVLLAAIFERIEADTMLDR